MRRRLINTTLGVVLVVVAVLGVPLAFVETHAIETTARDNLKAEAARVLETVDVRLAEDLPVEPAAVRQQVSEDRYALVELPGGSRIEVGTEPGNAFDVTMTGPRGERVTVAEERTEVTNQIRESLLLILAVALLAVAAAAGLAVWQARRLVRPLTDLAETAERLGSGDPRPRHRRYGVPELDRVAEVLDQSAERIARMLTAERRLAADASHQLRTPLTALSMRLEEIVATDDPATVKDEAAIALGQVERLTDVVQRLLTSTRRGGAAGRDPRTESAVTVAVDDVVRQQVDEWRPAIRNAGRSIEVTGQRGLEAVATPGALAQVLATLLENALMHGAGTVTIRTRRTGTSVVVEVEDEGGGVSDELGARVFERAVSGHNSTGLGLAVARDLAEADGGRLELLQQRPPVFAVFVTAARD